MEIANRKMTPIDASIARRLKQAREAKEMSVTRLATALDLSEAQYYKYENGQNRISAGMLVRACMAMNVSVKEFFADLDKPFETMMTAAQEQLVRIAGELDGEWLESLLTIAHLMRKFNDQKGNANAA